MTLPNREWFRFHVRTIERHSADNGENTASRWTTNHIEVSKIGNLTAGAASFWSWKTIIIPTASDFELVAGMDEVIDFGITLNATIEHDDCSPADFNIYWDPLDCPVPAYMWDPDMVSGRFYDGINQWQNYPQYMNCFGGEGFVFPAAAYPISATRWIAAYPWGGPEEGNQTQAELFQQGLAFYLDLGGCGGGCVSPLGIGEELSGRIEPLRLQVNYFNPVVNSLSRRSMTPAGGVELILTGLAFDQDNNEISSAARNSTNVWRNWVSIVDRIEFIGQQGQGSTIITSAGGDFTVDSDTQITIPIMPALAEGTYEIRLEKSAVAGIGIIEGYAGDWRAAADGRVREGVRFSFFVGEGDGAIIDPKGTLLYSKWAFKAKDGSTIFQYWAPIDVRSTERFYDGRLISESGITRAIDDRSGLPSISDMSVDVAVDKELRQLLAGYMLKNQLVELYFGWANQPEAWKQNVITMIIDDHHIEGDVLKVTLKDITQKYFRISVPRYIITLDEYPNAHESAIGQPMSEALGFCSKTDDPPGAINAQYIDTTAFKYLALRGSAHAILEVYSDGIAMVEGAGNDYTISYEDGGRTYINFNLDQGDNKITFNCEGYMFAAWNSLNGYVQNPAYIIGFLFAFLAEIPDALLDLTAIDTLAAIFEARAGGDICGSSGECEWSGYLIIQDFQPLETVAQELNFTYGSKLWPDHEGRFTFGIKDLTNWQSDIWIFEQIDALKPSARKEGLREMMNFVKAQYGNIPTASAFSGSIEESRPGLIVDYEAQIEAADSPWKFPWTNSFDLVSRRVLDELYKRGNGVKEISFSLAIDWIFELDIFDSFIYQNPFAPTLSGEGQQQWYYYVKSLSYNFVDNTIDFIGIDLQWLLRQCFIIGVCADMAESWMDATEQMRLFGYVCECELSGLGSGFPDGEPCKKICPC